MNGIMRYAVIVNAGSPDPDMHEARLRRFIRDNGFEGCDGTLIMTSGHCMPGYAAGYLAAYLEGMDMILLPGNKFGEELAVHLEARLSGSSITGAMSAEMSGGCLKVCRKIYAGHVIGTYELSAKPYILAASQALPAEAAGDEPDPYGRTIYISSEDIGADPGIRDIRMKPLETASELDAADVVIAGGMGLGGRKAAEEFRDICDAAGIPYAGSRPCAMNAWVPMDRMLGVSGRIISPEIAILLGISGAPAFYEGISGSGHIIAVNNDPSAPVARKSDLIVTGDCMAVFREFARLLESRRTDR